MVGDRGMIKSGQVKDLGKAEFNYITAITKPQIKSMIKNKVIQLGLFDKEICEVEHDGVHYILRRNPIRADELARSRNQRIEKVKRFVQGKNQYLADHPKADQHKAIQKVWELDSRLKVSEFTRITAKERVIRVELYEDYLSNFFLKFGLNASISNNLYSLCRLFH